MIRKFLLATAALAGLTSTNASAGVVYTFESPVLYELDPARLSRDFTIRLELTEAGNSFNLFGAPNPTRNTPVLLTGDVGRFVSLTFQPGQRPFEEIT